ncbi:hypothetical protein H4R24_002081 [Coemansia sp. RSA 988]|nr:hypothetical protein H4R24_002081 [Coemansia sp. RSA 988]
MGVTAQSKGTERQATEQSARRFREIHYHRFPLGARSNIHGTCLLRSQLPVRLPRPHTMQLIYSHPPPGVGYRRGAAAVGSGAAEKAAHMRAVATEIRDERRRVRQWLEERRAPVRTHVVVATQSGLQFFVAGFGYWNVLDINLQLKDESCVGVKAFEVTLAPEQHDAAEQWRASRAAAIQTGDKRGLQRETKAGAEAGAKTDIETEAKTDIEREAKADALTDSGLADVEQERLPMFLIALTTYVRRPSEARDGVTDESGTYRLYALGYASLPPLPQQFLDAHALDRTETRRAHSQPAEGSSSAEPAVTRRSASSGQEDGATGDMASVHSDSDETDRALQNLPINSYAYVEERLFGMSLGSNTLSVELDYVPFRISQDVVPGEPPIVAVAGNDNCVHRYAVGCDGIVEVEPLLCPKTDAALTFVAFDGRVIGNHHVQITAHQEFAVALQASRPLEPSEVAEGMGGRSSRKLMVADEEVFDAAPVAVSVFTPEARRGDRTAFDYAVTHRIRGETGRLAAGDVYAADWEIGTMDAEGAEARVHALVGFVGEDAVVYHDVAVAGLDPVPTLVGGAAGRVPASATQISGRLGGLGGVFTLGGSSRDGLITSVHFEDLDYDGTREILVGTVAGAVLVYKAVAGRGYVLVWRRRFPAPVYGLFSADINSDGASELIVVTLLGVHVLQPNLAQVRARLLRQLVARDSSREGSGTSCGKDDSDFKGDE